jgi:ribosome-binding factor A
MARQPSSKAGPSQRQLRVGELVRHALADILQRGDINDEVIAAHVITVPEVRMSPDLKHATVYVVPLGGKDDKPVVAALERHKRYIKGELARRIREFRAIPDLRFRPDDRFDEALRIDRLLDDPRVRRDLDPREEPDEKDLES